ncbi:hypothetical protein ADG881_1570 [Alcanivorax sp. DG881]|nr:hypothetical protein ADG881_1570 [Alcanivorax sp. DG881]
MEKASHPEKGIPGLRYRRFSVKLAGLFVEPHGSDREFSSR